MAGSTLPESAQNSAQQALNAALADSTLPPKPAASEPESGSTEEEQVIELESSAPGIDGDRSVFDDPHTFNVKVSFSFNRRDDDDDVPTLASIVLILDPLV